MSADKPLLGTECDTERSDDLVWNSAADPEDTLQRGGKTVVGCNATGVMVGLVICTLFGMALCIRNNVVEDHRL